MQQPASREPPTYDGNSPPPYSARLITRAYTRDLRPPVIILTLIGLAWSLWSGISYLQDISSTRETAKLKTFDIVLGALMLGLAGIEVFGLFALWKNQLRWLHAYAWVASIGALLVLAIEVLRLVLHFVLKDDIISQCVAYNAIYFDGTSDSLGSAQDLQNDCQTSWQRNIYIDIAWLILAVLVGFFAAAMASALYHQSRDPSRTRTSAPSDAYRLNPYRNEQPFQPQQPFGAGPPGYAGDADTPYGDDKKETPYDGAANADAVPYSNADNLSDVTLRDERHGRV